MTVSCPVCGKPFRNLRAATQHLFRSSDADHRGHTDYDECEREIAKAHYGAPNGDNSTVDPNPQSEAHRELESIERARSDDGVTSDDGDGDDADWLTADGGPDARRANGSSEPRDPPEPETVDDKPVCPECGGEGRPVSELIDRWPDELAAPDGATDYDYFCPACTTANGERAEVEVWHDE